MLPTTTPATAKINTTPVTAKDPAGTDAKNPAHSAKKVDLTNSCTISFPAEKIESASGGLRRDLVRLYRQLRNHYLSAHIARPAGTSTIEQTLTELGLELEAYLTKKHLTFSFERSALQKIFDETVARWNKVVDDVSGNPADNTVSQAGFCNCQEHTRLQAAMLPFWFTNAGLTRRILGLSQDFTYGIVNESMRVSATQSDAYAMHWNMHNDDRLCEVCLGYGTGGANGYYLMHWFMPAPPPVHYGCRCQYQIITKQQPQP